MLKTFLMYAFATYACMSQVSAAVVWTQHVEAENRAVIDSGAMFNDWRFDLNEDGADDILFQPFGGTWEVLGESMIASTPEDGRIALLPEDYLLGDSLDGLFWQQGEVGLYTTRLWFDSGAPGLVTLGLALDTPEGYQYAWFRVAIWTLSGPEGSQTQPITMGFLYDYAYETEVGVSIFTPTNVPEPSTYVMIGGGLAVIILLGRRRRSV